MSVLVKDIEMPKGCLNCFVKAGWCPAIRKRMKEASRSDRWIPENYRHDDCPLIEVTEPHGRLGDLDRLEQMFADIDNAPYSGFDGTEPFYSAEDAAQIIRLAPTVIQASKGE